MCVRKSALLETYPTSSIMQPDHLFFTLTLPCEGKTDYSDKNYESVCVSTAVFTAKAHTGKYKSENRNENTHHLKYVSIEKMPIFCPSDCARVMAISSVFPYYKKGKNTLYNSLWDRFIFISLKVSCISTTTNLIDSASFSEWTDSAHVWGSSPVAMKTVCPLKGEKID